MAAPRAVISALRPTLFAWDRTDASSPGSSICSVRPSMSRRPRDARAIQVFALA